MKIANLTPANHDTPAQVRALAWSGRHAQAIELASRELGSSHLKMDSHLTLLDLRAESYIALGKLDLAEKDAGAMMKLAKTANKNVYMAQALNRQAFVQMRTGDLKAALKNATSSVRMVGKASRLSSLRAQSLLCLSETQFRAGKNKAAIDAAQSAIELFRSTDNSSGAGRAYWVLSIAYHRLNQAGDSRKSAQAALELCQQADDQYGVGNAYNVLCFTDVDIA